MPEISIEPPHLQKEARIGLVVGGAATAALLGWLCVGINFQQSCVRQDTPYLELCPQRAAGSTEQLTALRARVDANPGDANAYVQLALTDKTVAQSALVAAASQLAPTEPNLVTMQAALAIERQDMPKAAGLLVQLVQYHEMPRAADVLARLIAGGQGQLLYPYLANGGRWLGPTLQKLPQGQFSSALPLVVQALKVGTLNADQVRAYVRQLKAAKAWADAYSLWVALHGRPLQVLYNAGFDDAFQQDGFDWETMLSGPPSKAGAIIERKGAEARGATLDIRFTGRSFATPLVRQQLFLGEGRYRLRGDYMTRQLRMDQGLAWTVRCTASQVQAGRSAALGESGGAWQPFSFEFSVPPGCGLISNLQLETFAPFEAALGARGRIAFDGFSLEKLTQ